MKIAIIGGGVSGLTCAHLLDREHEVTVFEAAASPGGHTNTVAVPANGNGSTVNVDTGFIVYNDRNYPLFERLLGRLGVETQASRMSFSVASETLDLEYAGTPRGLFAQPRNVVSAPFWGMLRDLRRFNASGRTLVEEADGGDPDISLGDWLERERFSDAFVERLIVPQASAVWSADPRQMWSFPARFLLQFFHNHGMFGLRDRPQWRTVSGGSRSYVEALLKRFGGQVRLRTPVERLARAADAVEVTAGGATETFDHAIVATHSDQALALLADPSAAESELLGAIPYQANEAVLHTDRALLPRRRAAWASWNFHLLAEPKPRTTITYWMNNLQSLEAGDDYCVTLNMTERIHPDRVIRTIDYAHPVFTPAGIRAQGRWHEVSSLERRTHYCGAYWRWGFHEDGVWSAQRVCEAFGASL